ncbi:MAG: HxsD-like protein [Candidatus Binatia bacterium]
MRLSFARSLYLPEAVDAAAAAYAEVARIAVTHAGEAAEVEITDVVEHEPALVGHAFANHALYETIARRRQATTDEAS